MTLTFIFALITASSAMIRNGYADKINSARHSLQGLTALLNSDSITSQQRRGLVKQIQSIERFILYYELTECLLLRYRTIAPDLYNEIDSIRDKRGRTTDVYVRFIAPDEAGVQAWGTTNLDHVDGDEDAYMSKFGPNTVSVKIWTVTKALQVLSHEFGHIKYQVPNLAEYLRFYKACYHADVIDQNGLGHKGSDPSGKSAERFDNDFRNVQARYLKEGNRLGKSPSILRDQISRRLKSSRTFAVSS